MPTGAEMQPDASCAYHRQKAQVDAYFVTRPPPTWGGVLRLLPAHRLMAVFTTLAAVITCLYLIDPSLRTPMWAGIGLASAAAIVTGVGINRPAHKWP